MVQPMPGGAAETRRPSWRGAIYHGVSAGLVAAFSFSTASLVPSLREPYWAPIAAVVVLYPARDATRRAAVERFIGTTIGSLIGWATADWWHQNLALYGLSVVVAVGLCYALRLENAARLCAVTVTVITLIPRAEAAYLVAFHRFVEVSYGVACALAYTMAAEAIRLRCKSGDAKA